MTSEPVFSVEYAQQLVQRARDGATFERLVIGNEEDGVWLPWRSLVGKREDRSMHWVEWYRETRSAFYLADNTHVEISVPGMWEADYSEAAIDLWLLLHEFEVAVDALCSLGSVSTWTRLPTDAEIESVRDGC